jgi:alkylation response protein AidB-like acyl-CoA dehydrogenase
MRQKIANIATDIWTAHLIAYKSGEMINRGHDSLDQACMMRFFASEAICKMAGDATAIFGAYSDLMEYWPEGSCCYSRSLVSGDGASKILQTIISREKVVL